MGVNLGTGTGMLLWRTPLKVFQKLLFHTPLVNIFIFASENYHDHFWYPVYGRKVVEQWLYESPWGQLFQRYPGDITPGQATEQGAGVSSPVA